MERYEGRKKKKKERRKRERKEEEEEREKEKKKEIRKVNLLNAHGHTQKANIGKFDITIIIAISVSRYLQLCLFN